MCEKSIPSRERKASTSVQDLGKEVISRRLIRILSASMEDTPAHAHEGVSGVGVDVEASADARVTGTASL